MEWKPDGRSLVVFDGGGRGFVFSMKDGTAETSFHGIYRFVNSRPALLPDQKHFVIGAHEWLGVFDLFTGKLVRSAEHGGEHPFRCWTALGEDKIASNLGAEGVAIWRSESMERVDWLRGYQKVSQIAASASGRLAVVSKGSSGEILQVVDPVTRECVWRSEEFEERLDALLFSPDSKMLATIQAGVIRVWDAKSGKVVHECKPKDPDGSGYSAVAFSPDDKTLIAGEWNGTICLLDRAGWREQGRIAGEANCNSAFAVSPDGRLLAAGGLLESVFLYDLKDRKAVPPGAGHTGGVVAAGFSREGRWVLTGSKDRTVRVWDRKSGKETHRLAGQEWSVGQLAAHPDGVTILAGGMFDEKIRVWNVGATATLRREIQGHSRLEAIALSPDGGTVAFAADGKLYARDVASGKARFEPAATAGHVRRMHYSPDGSTLLVVGSREVAFHDPVTGVSKRRSPLPEISLQAAHLSEDGRMLAMVDDRRILALEVATMQVVWDLDRRTVSPDWVASTANFLPDGRLLVGTAEGKILVWDGGEQPAQVGSHRGAVVSLAVAPDGREFVSGGADTVAKLWQVPKPTRNPSLAQDFDGEQFWRDLKSDDAVRAHRAMRAAIAAEVKALAQLDKKLVPAIAAKPADIHRLVAEVRSDRFAVRRRAFEGLAELDMSAEGALRAAARDDLPPDEKEQFEKLLSAIAIPSGDRLRVERAVRCAEMIGNQDALRLIKKWASGDSTSRLGRAATAAVDRVRARVLPQ